ncbi:hypothetical protein SPBRAN_1103 [uncultured Candidatus Thioglobus sp.]|nr:hypothetical protein SPBRAN_1103 [uncultured Candidatus Thioglobus sp.]
MDFNSLLNFIQTAALIAAVFVAVFAIRHQRAIAKKDKTIVLLTL